MYRIAWLLTVAALLNRGFLGAADPKEPWTVDDVILQERADGWALSPDGKHALWLKRAANKEKDARVATLMLSDLDALTHRPLSVGADGVSAAQFSPDGRRIAVLTSRKEPEGETPLAEEDRGAQIWLYDLGGGDAAPVTKVAFGVDSFAWLDDEHLLLSLRERRSRGELDRKDEKDKSIVVEDPRRYGDAARRLFRFALADKRLVRIESPGGSLELFAASRDGRFVVARYGQSPSFQAEADVPPRIYLHDLRSGSAVELFADRKSKPLEFQWRPDSQGFYALYPQSTRDGEGLAFVVTVKEVLTPSLEVRDVPLDAPAGVHFYVRPTADGFLAGLANGLRPKAARFVREGQGYRKELLTGDHAQRIFTVATARDADRVIYVTGSASDPSRVVVARLEGAALREPRDLYRPNEGFPRKPLAKTRVLRFAGAEGDEIEALVFEPHDYQAGKRYPLVLMTHGGPHGADYDRFDESWAYAPNLYAQRGAFVLRVNYHGSSDYGLAFAESIRGRYYELEIKDLLAGVQALIDQGLVDRERMGLIGWSNGAILSIGVLALGHQYAPQYDFAFKACAPGAGDVNWSSDYGNCDFGPYFDDYYLGGPPWKLPEVYRDKSPLFHVERVTTPTILFFGSEDRAVPTEQGWQWYRALHLVKQAPVRMVLFPGEPHSLQKLTHQRRKLTEELAWFDRYLFETTSAASAPPLKENSPLEVARLRREFPAREGAYGVVDHGTLTPETVGVAGLEVGRFEVTRAQWREFRPDVEWEPGTENYPATGIDLAQAQSYVAWLRERTGQPWRLLTEAEFEKLPSGEASEQNTLDWWAGYAPSPSDAAELQGRLREFEPRAVLQPVGSRAPAAQGVGPSRALLFDVGGNAAELVLTAEGQAKFVGGCAVLASDDRASSRDVPPEYAGLRVARGERP